MSTAFPVTDLTSAPPRSARVVHYYFVSDGKAALALGAPVQYLCGAWSNQPPTDWARSELGTMRPVKCQDCPICVRIHEVTEVRKMRV